MEGEGGLILLDSLSAQNEMIGGLGRSQVFDVHGAVGIQHLSETQLNIGAGRTFYADFREAGEVLAEVIDIGSGLGRSDLLCRDRLLNADGLETLRHDLWLKGLD